MKQSAMISDLYWYFEDECTRHAPDYVILHFGIVEATYRARPRCMQNYFSMNAWNNSVIDKPYNGPIRRGMKFVLKKMHKRIVEHLLYTLGVKWRWCSLKKFTFSLKDIVKRIFADSAAKKIILIGMTELVEWSEKQAPGSNESIRQYNEVMKQIASLSPNITYIDPENAFKGHQRADITPDGIHFTGLGHRLLADHIAAQLTGKRENYLGWQKINQYESLYSLYENRFKR